MCLSIVQLEKKKGEDFIHFSHLPLIKDSLTFSDWACLTATRVPLGTSWNSTRGAWDGEALAGFTCGGLAGFFLELAVIAMAGIQGEFERIWSHHKRWLIQGATEGILTKEPADQIYTIVSLFFVFFFFFFFLSRRAAEDLSSSTRDQTDAPCSGNIGVLTTGLPGKSYSGLLLIFNKCLISYP